MKKVLVFTVLALMLTATAAYSFSGRKGMRGTGTCDGSMIRQQIQEPGSAIGRSSGMWGSGSSMLLHFADELKLTDTQIDKIKALHLDFAKKNIELGAKMQIANLEKRELLTADNIDEKKLSAKIDEISQIYKQRELGKVKFFSEMKNILTKDQVEKVKDLRKKSFAEQTSEGGNFDRWMGHNRKR